MLHAGSAAVDRALLPTRFKLGNYNCRYRPKITVAAQPCPDSAQGRQFWSDRGQSMVAFKRDQRGRPELS